ncbi:hypothetical protein KAFR_0L01140 [Kazachstania africana CBS 2517]|uniref:CCHC-type domain-containing protein n=1 Tax=Kazachstania africana (strain ATCC 22294 / BCRC 22015 / CBS 2517 / CECT 1963 / NBRC 1671 / NRRL Y-8276) TaxID=1071382 RepID=H2B272_KAZAF|nr:hypothetical protein KAFR_0L01140 [Kazachstania africana CBS 2517]CCF60722.1 hypothetical protein KAFR_0L01140 [Kazachstania africana CBS 2517]
MRVADKREAKRRHIRSKKHGKRSKNSIKSERHIDNEEKKHKAKCKICLSDTHRTKTCPRSLCKDCGMMRGRHVDFGKSKICNNVSVRHYSSSIEDEMESVQCENCGQNGHKKNRCDKIWRKYLMKRKTEMSNEKMIPLHTIFCYRCGSKGHYGDDCTKRQNNSPRVVSAFSGKNLTRNLSEIYYSFIEEIKSSDLWNKDIDDINHLVKNEYTRSLRPSKVSFYPPPYKNMRRPSL